MPGTQFHKLSLLGRSCGKIFLRSECRQWSVLWLNASWHVPVGHGVLMNGFEFPIYLKISYWATEKALAASEGPRKKQYISSKCQFCSKPAN